MTVRTQFCAVWVAVAVYVIAFAAYFPNVVTIADEAAYVRQAVAFSHGEAQISRVNVLSRVPEQVKVSDYPPGTSALMTPFVAAGGWRAAFLIGPVSLVVIVLVLAIWLQASGRPPLFALLALAYPPMLIMSRCGTSDLPSTALVTVSLYLFWCGEGRRAWWFGAGLLAGCSWLFRDTNPVLLTALFAGACVRRERNLWLLVIGAAVGLALRPIASWAVYAELFHKNPGVYAFSLSALGHTAPVYLFALMVMVPGGLVFVALYQGARRVELQTTVIAFVALYLLYSYSGESSGGLKQLILAPRYFCPLIPILTFAMAHVVPTVWERIRSSAGSPRGVPRVPGMQLGAALALAVGIEAVVLNWAHARWSRSQRDIVVALHAATHADRPVISNLVVTRKYLNELYDREFGARAVVDLDSLRPESIERLLARNGTLDIVLLTRTGGSVWRVSAAADTARVASWRTQFDVRLVTDTLAGGEGETIRAYQVRAR